MPEGNKSAPRPRSNRRRRQRGQSLIEYSLLLAFVALACIGIMESAGNSSSGIWSSANSQLAAADNSLSPAATPAAGGDHRRGDGGDGGDGHNGH